MGTPMQKISQFEAERRQRQIFIGLESKKRRERRIIFLKGFATCAFMVLIAVAIVAVTHQDPLTKYSQHLFGLADGSRK